MNVGNFSRTTINVVRTWVALNVIIDHEVSFLQTCDVCLSAAGDENPQRCVQNLGGRGGGLFEELRVFSEVPSASSSLLVSCV